MVAKKSNTQVVKQGDQVKLDYEGSLDDGEIFDTSTHGDHSHPLEFEVGAGQVIPGFDKAVIGMKKGEEKSFIISSKEAYGESKKELIQEVPKDNLPKEQELKAGMVLMAGTPDGRQFPVKVVEVEKNIVKIDLNHPLAGKNLHFKIKILEIN